MSKLFSQIDIETNNFCTRKCIFCPQYEDKRKEIIELPFETIKKVVDELKELNYRDNICLTGYGEPTFDKRLPEIIKYIHTELPKCYIHFYSNGDIYKTPEQYIELFKNGLGGIYLSIYDEKNRDKIINICNGVIELYGKEKIENSEQISEKPKSGMIKFFFIDKTEPFELKSFNAISNRAGNLPWLIPNPKKPLEKMCSFPFRKMAIKSSGEVIICCNDYYNRGNPGNIKNETIKNIWEGKIFTEVRRHLINKNRDIEPCRLCDNKNTYYHAPIFKEYKELIEISKVVKQRSLFE